MNTRDFSALCSEIKKRFAEAGEIIKTKRISVTELSWLSHKISSPEPLRTYWESYGAEGALEELERTSLPYASGAELSKVDEAARWIYWLNQDAEKIVLHRKRRRGRMAVLDTYVYRQAPDWEAVAHEVAERHDIVYSAQRCEDIYDELISVIAKKILAEEKK